MLGATALDVLGSILQHQAREAHDALKAEIFTFANLISGTVSTRMTNVKQFPKTVATLNQFLVDRQLNFSVYLGFFAFSFAKNYFNFFRFFAKKQVQKKVRKNMA